MKRLPLGHDLVSIVRVVHQLELPEGDSVLRKHTTRWALKEAKRVEALVAEAKEAERMEELLFLGELATLTRADLVATENVDELRGSLFVDGHTVPPNSYILLTAQWDKIQNGLWRVRSGDWRRANVMAEGKEVRGMRIYVSLGVFNTGTVWKVAGMLGERIVGKDELTIVRMETHGQKEA